MRIAVLSDIHGNLPALEAVLEDVDTRGADAIVVLGDLSFKGPYPAECLQRVMDIKPVAVIQGNTDQWLAEGLPSHFTPDDEAGRRMIDFYEWTRDRLGSAGLRTLAQLPFSHETRLGAEFAVFVHATPASNVAWVPLSSPDEELDQHFQHPEATVFFAGHVHTPGLRRLSGHRTVVNTGSVGMPWDGDWRASYAILEADGQRIAVNLIRVPYNMERTLEAARRTGMPWSEEYSEALRLARLF